MVERERYGPLLGLAVLLELTRCNYDVQSAAQVLAATSAMQRQMRSLRARRITRPHVRAWFLLCVRDAHWLDLLDPERAPKTRRLRSQRQE